MPLLVRRASVGAGPRDRPLQAAVPVVMLRSDAAPPGPSCIEDRGMRRLVLAFSFVVSFLLTFQSAHASLVVQIDKSRQRMTVLVDGQPRYSWLVSTGRNGFG